MKRLSELINECKDRGIPIPEGTKVSKEDLITRLANHNREDAQGISPLEEILPQLAKDIGDLPENEKEEVLRSDRFACGEKKNGIRGILHIRPEGNRFTSRNRCSDTYLLNELTENLPHLSNLDFRQWEGSIFDGELYLPGDFAELSDSSDVLEATTALLHCSPDKARAFQEKHGQKIRYHIFDVLKANGDDIVSVALKERLKYLNEFRGFIESSGQGQHVQFENLILHDKEHYFKTIIEAGGEGIVFKDLNAPYYPGARSRSWLKLKKHTTVDAIIIGFDRGKEWDKKGLIGSVELGIFDECGALRSIGSVSSFPLQRRISFTEADRRHSDIEEEISRNNR